MLFQKTWVQSPTPTWQLTTACNSSSRGSGILTQMCMQAKHQCTFKKKRFSSTTVLWDSLFKLNGPSSVKIISSSINSTKSKSFCFLDWFHKIFFLKILRHNLPGQRWPGIHSLAYASHKLRIFLTQFFKYLKLYVPQVPAKTLSSTQSIMPGPRTSSSNRKNVS